MTEDYTIVERLILMRSVHFWRLGDTNTGTGTILSIGDLAETPVFVKAS